VEAAAVKMCICSFFKVGYMHLVDIKEHLGLNSACGFSVLAPLK